MTIQSLRPYIWIGWISGFVYLQKPWGPPEFKSWLSWHTLWALIVFSLQMLAFVDLYQSDISVSGWTDENKVSNLLMGLMMGNIFLSHIAFLTVFIRHARPLARILNDLSQHKALKSRLSRCFLIINVFNLLATFCTTACSVLMSIVNAEGITESKILKLNGLSFAIVFAIAYLASLMTRPVALALISRITFNFSTCYDEFCDRLETELLRSKMSTPISTVGKEIQVQDSKDPWVNGNSYEDEDSVVLKYHEFINLSKAASNLLSPLTFILMVGAVATLIPGTYWIIVGTRNPVAVATTLTMCAEQLVYIGLIFMGQNVKDLIITRQDKLRQIIGLEVDSLLATGNKTVAIARLMTKFKWSISGCGVFDVDRKLISGILTTSMTYIVIIFQFQLALEPPRK